MPGIQQISIEFADRKTESSPVNWTVVIEGKELKRFLWHVLYFLNDGYPGPFE